MPPTEPAWHTEADLRDTLVAVADRDEPDVDAFRSRLAAADATPAGEPPITGQHDDGSTGVGVVHDLDPQGRARARRQRVISRPGLAVAACVAAVLLVVGVVYGRHDGGLSDRPGYPGSSLPRITLPFPGTVIVGQYAGVGPTLITVPRVHLAAHEELASYAECKGSGSLQITPGGLAPSCEAGISDSFPTSIRTLRVTVQAKTVWRLALVRQPELRANGYVGEPVDPEFAHPKSNELGRGSGRGAGRVQAHAVPENTTGSGGVTARLVLTCHGSGVRITSASPGFRTLYTHTCFAGSQYVFDLKRGQLPASLQVAASPGTTWQLFVVSF